MKLLRQEGNHCLLYAAAMLLDERPERLIEEIGHDGTKLVFDRKPPWDQRNFSIEEIQDCCYRRKMLLACVDAEPVIGNCESDAVPVYYDPLPRLESMIYNQPGILVLKTLHAVAWDGQTVFDPHGKTYPVDLGSIETAWLLAKLI